MANKNIGIILRDNTYSVLTHDFFSPVVNNFMKFVEEKDYTISFFNTSVDNPDRKRYLEQARDNKYDGVLIACIDFTDPEVIELMESGIPLVTLDVEVDGVISVISDNRMGMTELAEHIIGMGHKKIAYITGEDCPVTTTRLKAFIDACNSHGIEIPADFIKKGKFRDINGAGFFTEELMRLPDPPTCIIYSDDYASIGGINVLRARGIEIPMDISVAGYDGIFTLSQYEPKLTTVVQDKEALGKAAAINLIEWMENPEGYKLNNTIVVPTILEKGRSVGKIYF